MGYTPNPFNYTGTLPNQVQNDLQLANANFNILAQAFVGNDPTTGKVKNANNADNADTVDGFHASLTPAPNVIVPLNSAGILDLSATSALINVYAIRRIDGNSLTSHYPLKIGEEAIYTWDTTKQLNFPLYIATVEGIYMLIVVAPYQTASNCFTHLNPNDTTYSNAFTHSHVGLADGDIGPGGQTSVYANFSLVNATAGGITICFISTFTKAKFLVGIQRITRYTSSGALHHFGARWNDTTTPWTSLGTITTSTPNGTITILVRRLA